jgi:hypothetical protein
VPIEGFVWALAGEFLAEAIAGARLGAPGGGRGRVVSALSVRCLRAWRPFCWGVPGSMHSGRRPRRTHHAESGDRRARVVVAQGTPWSVRIRFGRPNALHKRVNTGVAADPRVDASAWPPSRKRLEPSATVSGEP